MRTNTILAGCLATAVSFLTACSHIDEDERLIYVEPTYAERVVLVEDFTGQKCVNCPNATNVLHDILEAYGKESIIPVAIHCGPFGLNTAAGLVTETGKTYWSAFFSDTQGQPVAKINRGAANDDYKNWAKAIANELGRLTNVSLNVKTTYAEDEGRQLQVSISALGKAGENQKLQLWLVEDSIVATQALPTGGVDRQYVHNHVLREALNGDWGEDITFAEDSVRIQKHYNLNEKYKARNCYLVAFTYDDSGVSQATRAKVFTTEN
ncbi:MAG: Omp28 family outer membrane lipoprotein [Bacteroidaceae bacterium]